MNHSDAHPTPAQPETSTATRPAAETRTDPDAVASVTTCPSCETERVGTFCHTCGERLLEERLSLKWLRAQLRERFISLDRGFLHTVWALTRRPGSVQRDVVEGLRRPYVNPLTYFFIAATLQLLMMTINEAAIYEAMYSQTEQTMSLTVSLMKGFIDDPAAQEEVVAKVMEPSFIAEQTDASLARMKSMYSYLAFLMCIPFALFLVLFLSGKTHRYNFTESFVFALYSIGHIMLLTAIIAPLTVRFSIWLHSGISILGYIVYCALAARRFYDGSVKSMVLTAISFIGGFIAFQILIFVGALVGGFAFGYLSSWLGY